MFIRGTRRIPGGAAGRVSAKYMPFAGAEKILASTFTCEWKFFFGIFLICGAEFCFFHPCISKLEKNYILKFSQNSRKSRKFSDIVQVDHMYTSRDFIFSVCNCLRAIFCFIFLFLLFPRIFFLGFLRSGIIFGIKIAFAERKICLVASVSERKILRGKSTPADVLRKTCLRHPLEQGFA